MKNLKKVLAVIICAVMLLGVMPGLSVSAASDTTDTGRWTTAGCAYYDDDNGYYVLTEKTGGAGAIWYDKVSYADLDVSFDYYTGDGTGSYGGGDGMTLIFYGDSDRAPSSGGNLGFGGNGYAVELDTFKNPIDPPAYNLLPW